MPVSRPGTQKRDFTHVEDVVEGLLIVAKKGNGDGYGIGSTKSYSIIELAHMMNKKIKFKRSVKGNRKSALVKSHKTKKLGWKPKILLSSYVNDKLSEYQS